MRDAHPLTNNMSHRHIQTAATALSESVATLKTELQTLESDSDAVSLTTVMGTLSEALAITELTELMLFEQINSFQPLTSALEAVPLVDRDVKVAVQLLIMDSVREATDKLRGHFNRTMALDISIPWTRRTKAMTTLVDGMSLELGTIKSAAASFVGSRATDHKSKLNETAFTTEQKLIRESILRFDRFDAQASVYSTQINDLLAPGAAGDLTNLPTLQTARKALEHEEIYDHKALKEYFVKGSKTMDRDERRTTVKLVIPDNLHKGKDTTLGFNVLAYLNCHVSEYFAILPEIRYVLAQSKIGLLHEPPSKGDDYAGVDSVVKQRYELASARLYSELEAKCTSSYLADIRKEFPVGLEERKVKCTEGDGVYAIFCLLALYRPMNMQYREDIKDKLASCVGLFSNGTSPVKVIEDFYPALQEAIDLGIPIQWSRVGRHIVTTLSERNNAFALALHSYNSLKNISDVEDSAVDTARMFADVTKACADLESAGVNINASGQKRAAYAIQEVKDCYYGLDCNRSGCSYVHPKGFRRNSVTGKGERKGKGDSKGKGKSPGKSKGKGKGDSKGKGGKGEPKSSPSTPQKSTLCDAKGCQSSGQGRQFCPTCHRKYMEAGKTTLKDGTEITTTKRASMVTFEDEKEAPEDFSFSPADPRCAMMVRHDAHSETGQEGINPAQTNLDAGAAHIPVSGLTTQQEAMLPDIVIAHAQLNRGVEQGVNISLITDDVSVKSDVRGDTIAELARSRRDSGFSNTRGVTANRADLISNQQNPEDPVANDVWKALSEAGEQLDSFQMPTRTAKEAAYWAEISEVSQDYEAEWLCGQYRYCTPNAELDPVLIDGCPLYGPLSLKDSKLAFRHKHTYNRYLHYITQTIKAGGTFFADADFKKRYKIIEGIPTPLHSKQPAVVLFHASKVTHPDHPFGYKPSMHVMSGERVQTEAPESGQCTNNLNQMNSDHQGHRISDVIYSVKSTSETTPDCMWGTIPTAVRSALQRVDDMVATRDDCMLLDDFENAITYERNEVLDFGPNGTVIHSPIDIEDEIKLDSKLEDAVTNQQLTAYAKELVDKSKIWSVTAMKEFTAAATARCMPLSTEEYRAKIAAAGYVAENIVLRRAELAKQAHRQRLLFEDNTRRENIKAEAILAQQVARRFNDSPSGPEGMMAPCRTSQPTFYFKDDPAICDACNAKAETPVNDSDAGLIRCHGVTATGSAWSELRPFGLKRKAVEVCSDVFNEKHTGVAPEENCVDSDDSNVLPATRSSF